MFKNYLSIINFILILGLGAYVLFANKATEQKGYVLNQQVFEAFTGTKELEQRLTKLKNSHQAVLDSLASALERNRSNSALSEQYQRTLQAYQLEYEETSQRYTADIWKRINHYISEYGKANNYDFIFGATGNGGLMYANDVNNITEEVVTYINKRYAEGN